MEKVEDKRGDYSYKVGVLIVVEYPEWLANIVPKTKGNGKDVCRLQRSEQGLSQG